MLNLDAARLWRDAPHTYKQIALDCVVASLRIDGGYGSAAAQVQGLWP